MQGRWGYLIIWCWKRWPGCGCQSRDQFCQLGVQSLLWSGQPPKMFIISYFVRQPKEECCIPNARIVQFRQWECHMYRGHQSLVATKCNSQGVDPLGEERFIWAKLPLRTIPWRMKFGNTQGKRNAGPTLEFCFWTLWAILRSSHKRPMLYQPFNPWSVEGFSVVCIKGASVQES